MAAAQKDPIRALFVCLFNRRRSATAERVFAKDPALDARSAGIDADARVQVNGRMLEWADVVFVMEDEHRRALHRMFPDHPGLQRVVCLDIPDVYAFLDETLVWLLRERTAPHLARLKDS